MPTVQDVAATYVPTIVAALAREYPNAPRHVTTGDHDRPTPRELHPSFYGCFDWHSAVEMHWALLVLLRTTEVPRADALDVLDTHLAAAPLAVEAAYLREHPGFERPYGWGWLLTLADEATRWPQPWADHLRPVADAVTDAFVDWLPKMTYPQRSGMHANSAFGCVRALPWARRLADDGDSRLLLALTEAARRWFAADDDAPVRWEPDGADFLSPSLTEAVLMTALAPDDGWLDRWLPCLNYPALPTYTPAVVSDAADGQITHLHGLNLYRAHAWRELARAYPEHPAQPLWQDARERHLEASVGAVVGGHWMAEHWLAAFAVLALA